MQKAEINRIARQMMALYHHNAELEAVARYEALADVGDMEGHADWCDIANAIVGLSLPLLRTSVN